MAPRNVRKAQTKGSETPLRRSRRLMGNDIANFQEKIPARSDELEGKQSTDVNLVNSPRTAFGRSGRSNKEKNTARTRQNPIALEESVLADYNSEEGVGTRFVSGVGERPEQGGISLERAL